MNWKVKNAESQSGRWPSLLILLLVSVCLSLGPSACVTPASTSRQSLTWEAKRGTQVVTVVGTMHVGVSPEEIPPGLWDRLEKADTVVTEVDLTHMDPQLAQRYLVLPSPGKLEMMMKPDDWQQFQSTVQTAFPQITTAELQRMTVLAACSTLMLAEAQLAQSAHADPEEARKNIREEPSMDQFIIDKARSQGKTLKTFETLEQQFRFLQEVLTLEQLQEMLQESAENRQYYAALSRSYKDGDGDGIDSMVAMMPAKLRAVLLDQRNAHWGQRLPELLSPRHSLIAVGAAHLGGDKGLLRILASQGFELRPLKLTQAR